MSIYKKNVVEQYLQELDKYHTQLRKELEGSTPSSSLAELYHESDADFERLYTEVDFDKVLIQLDHFKVAVTHIRQLKGKAVKRVGK